MIDVRDAWKSYHVGSVEVQAVRGVSLRLEHGDFVAVTGASGSGKSTFLNLIGCLDQIDRGSYAFEGRPTERLSRRDLATLRNRRIGFVFQTFNLLPRSTIVYNVALPLAYQGVTRRERNRRAAEMLERVGLADRLKHHPNQLSGGQQQRVAIARALVTQPVVVLADEPTGNLDSKTGKEIMAFLRQLNCDEGMTILLVTHEADVAGYAHREIVFRDGQIVHDGLPAAKREMSEVS
ncbi:MAG: ABC transporter ATP-binding protein [Phycisphaerae bacterium]|nr:ABC transporter ATP-binding protein [Phycisphaerae bacterium]